ncbi:hypothetical protein [Roseovarius salis]|uniref:hypothetical protein n=1 Tax=Roseovarius salis TaxID=3376063 RepID=UPI0037CAD6C0
MRFTVVIMLIASIGLAGCGGSLRESRLNPVNWFGSSTSQEVESGTVTTADGRVEEINPLIGEDKQSQLVAANRSSLQKSGILRRRNKESPYLGTRVDQVTELGVEPTSTGAIVRVSGLSGRQGAFDVRLLPLDEDQPQDGVMTYELLALQPVNTPQGPARTRQLQAAAPLSSAELDEIRTIRVIARRNVRTTRR